MAVNTFYQLCEEILSLRAGSSFHDSYFGDQIRPINNSGSSVDYRTDLRKGKFSYLHNTWHGLTSAQRNSFITEAGTLPEALRLFLTVNINLIICLQPVITTFVPSGTPIAFPVLISTLDGTLFEVEAAGPVFVVPANHCLLLYATYEKQVAKVFTNPNNYTPIKVFNASKDLSLPTDIAAEWRAYFGQFTQNKRICIKSVLIDTTNGTSGNETIVCSTVSPIETYYIIDSDGTIIIDTDGTYVVSE